MHQSSLELLNYPHWHLVLKNKRELRASVALVYFMCSLQVLDGPGKRIAFPWVELLREPRYYFAALIWVFPLSQKWPRNILLTARMNSHMQSQAFLMTWHLNSISEPIIWPAVQLYFCSSNGSFTYLSSVTGVALQLSNLVFLISGNKEEIHWWY